MNLREKINAFERALTVREVANLLNVSVPLIYRMASSRRIPSIKIGGTVRFNPGELLEWLEAKESAVRKW